MEKAGFRRADAGKEAERYGWPIDAWVFVRECQYDSTSERLRIELDQIGIRAPAFVGGVVRAALEPLEGGGYRRTWTDGRARQIGILLVAIFKASQATRRIGHRRLCKGITLGSMCALLEHPISKKRPHKNTLVGRHFAGASLANGTGHGLGYLLAADEADALYAQQLPPECVERAERWIVRRRNKETGQLEPHEYASNRYWINCAHPHDAHLSDEFRARALELSAYVKAVADACVRVVTRRAERLDLERRLAELVRPAPD
jgi:hypothetical protein